LKNRQTLSEKLLAIASQSQQDALVELKQLLRFENTNPANVDLLELTDLAPAMLKIILNASLVSRHLRITVASAQTYDSYVQYLYHQGPAWQVVIFELASQQTRTLPLGQIQQVAIDATELPADITDQIKQAQPKPNLIVQLGAAAIQQFKRLHRPDRLLQYLDPFEQTARYTDYVDVTSQSDLALAASWLLYLGPAVTSDKSSNNIKNKLNSW